MNREPMELYLLVTLSGKGRQAHLCTFYKILHDVIIIESRSLKNRATNQNLLESCDLVVTDAENSGKFGFLLKASVCNFQLSRAILKKIVKSFKLCQMKGHRVGELISDMTI